jgi:hypothetical protein
MPMAIPQVVIDPFPTRPEEVVVVKRPSMKANLRTITTMTRTVASQVDNKVGTDEGMLADPFWPTPSFSRHLFDLLLIATLYRFPYKPSPVH